MAIPKLISPMNVLLAFDASPASYAGVSLLSQFPLPPRSKVTFLRVVAPGEKDDGEHARVMDRAGKPLVSLGYPLQREIVQGSPAEQIKTFASKKQCDLIVVSATGERGLIGRLLGSVAQQVAEQADRAVLVVRPSMRPPRCILLATDGSQPSLHAAGYLGAFPHLEGSQVIVLYVIPPLPLPDPTPTLLTSSMSVHRGALLEYTARGEFTSLHQVEEARGEQVLKTTVQAINHTLFGRLPVVNITCELREGDPAEEILKFAREIDADLIVTGSRGLSQVKGWLLGSVSRKVTHDAHCSVLVARGLAASPVPGSN